MNLTDGEDLQTTVLNAPIGICILNADTLVTELVNDKFLEVAGKPYDAIFGKFYWDAFAEARSYEAALSSVVQTGEAYYANEVELMLIRHGREETIFVTFVYAPVKDSNGKVKKVAVWVLENTKQVYDQHKAQAERAAFERERDRLKDFFMQAPAGICILSGAELVYELVNPGYQLLLPGRKLLNRPIFEALPELVGTPLEQVLLNVFRTGQSYQINESLIPIAEYEGGPTRDRYFSFNYHARRDENDKVDGIMVFVFEVSGLMKVQHDLREARELSDQQKRVYETITQATPDLMYVFGLDYRFIYANSALLNMWGKTWENAVGKSLLENGYEPWHAEMHEREIDQIRVTKQPIRGEVSFPHATLGRRVYDYILNPVINEQGEVEAVAGTTRDITERKQWEQALAQTSEELQSVNEELASTNEELASTNEELTVTNEELGSLNLRLLAAQQNIEMAEERMRMAIDAAGLGTYYTNIIDRVFYPSAKLKEFFGYGPDEEMPDGAVMNQIHPDYRQEVSDMVEAAITKGIKFDKEYPIIGHNDGKMRWVRGIGTVQQDEKGVDKYFTGVLHEITEQKQDEIRKNDFIGMVSHELKTPLTSLNAYLQVLQNKSKSSNDGFTSSALDNSVKQVKKMTTMINGFLNVSRLESGKIHIERQRFDMAELAKETEIETLAMNSSHRFIFHPVETTIVDADRDKIGQVINNLVSNAVKYSRPGSTIQVACVTVNNEARFSVSDEGIGIRPEDVGQLFERYYRVENDSHVSGFGIGLYLSAEIIKRHDGKIWVESEPGKGSVFYFSLHLAH